MLDLAPAIADAPEARADRRAFEALIAEHLPGLRARATELCRRHVDPDDLVQEALVRAFRGQEQLRDPARTRSWLLTIVANTFVDLIRKQRSRREEVGLDHEPVASGDEPDEPLPWQRLGAAELRAAIDRLPDDVRDTYRMFAIEGLDYTAIAAAQQIPKATVGTRLLRARKRLRVLLAAELEVTS